MTHDQPAAQTPNEPGAPRPEPAAVQVTGVIFLAVAAFSLACITLLSLFGNIQEISARVRPLYVTFGLGLVGGGKISIETAAKVLPSFIKGLIP